ncbi:High molecular weight rubredoxin [candidate division WOR-3 bacterium]|nr:High molecular weight rubredoxin [candidate division WOR-3 bacterium]
MDLSALNSLTYGLYIVTSRAGERINGLTVNTVVQVALEPCLVTVAVNKASFTNELIQQSGLFAVTVLEKETPLEFIGRFGFRSGREVNKFDGLNYEVGETGVPLVTEHAIVVMEAKVREKVDCATHTLFVGEVVMAKWVKQGEPLTYAYYHEVKKGKTGKGAPTYQAEKEKEKLVDSRSAGKTKEQKMQRYVCTVCGYVYDPAEGDPDNGIPAGTPFESLPPDWVCPVCGASKDQFEPEE